MRYSSHVIASLCLGAAVSAHTTLPFTAAYTAGLVIGSLLPDIDEPSSYVGRRSFGVSDKIKEAFGHRGMTHSLIAWGVLAALVWRDSASPFAMGLVLGYLFHIVEDFFPSRECRCFGRFRPSGGKCRSIGREKGWRKRLCTWHWPDSFTLASTACFTNGGGHGWRCGNGDR
ncbi:Inner membrane protein YdjM [Geobacillus sp. BCO2]|nr:Inner membrane protein YdjM [Geobacillus sp. BCO2]